MTDKPVIVVSGESPVLDQTSKLYRWDSSVRKHFNEFELSIAALGRGINMIYKNPLTSFKDPVQLGHRYHELQILKHRQQLGAISPSEVSEASSALFDGIHLVTTEPGAKGTPHQLCALNLPILGGSLAAGGAMGLYGVLVRRTSFIWLIGSVVPFMMSLAYNKSRQPY